jgi:hypothetical protein
MRLCLCLLSALSWSIQAHATVINFDDLTGQSCNNKNITTCGPNVIDQYAALGVTFNNPTPAGQDVADTLLTPLIPDTSSPNVLFVYQGGTQQTTPFDPFQILFSVPVTSVGFDYGSSTDSFLELDVYDSSNTLLETVDFVGNSAPSIGLAGFASVQESTPIARVDVSYHPDADTGESNRTLSFSIDNLQFSPVPEPSTFAMIAVGALGIALGRRRRTRV